MNKFELKQSDLIMKNIQFHSESLVETAVLPQFDDVVIVFSILWFFLFAKVSKF